MNGWIARVRGLRALGLAALIFAGLLQFAGAQTRDSTAMLKPAHTISHGVFVDIPVFRPSGQVRQFVLLFSGTSAPNAKDQKLVRWMVGKGAMVLVVPLGAFYDGIAAVSRECVHGPGGIENFARYVQAYEKLPVYLEPLLVGTGKGGAFVYGLLAQAPADTFAGAVSLDFCPRLALPMPLCAEGSLRWHRVAGGVDFEAGPRLTAPWSVLQGEVPPSCAAEAEAFMRKVPGATWVAPTASGGSSTQELPAGFQAAFEQLAKSGAAPEGPPAELADLPITEVPAGREGTRFAVMISGDGGWAGIDKGVAASLAESGVPVVGIDSLRYFWSARTPEGIAVDLDRVIRHYAARWRRSEVVLIGYSQGADVLPFALNRLPAPTRAQVRLTALLGPGEKASFEFHLSNWIGKSGDRPIAPEARNMPAKATLCIYGTEERKDSLCPLLESAGAHTIAMPGGHHFGGDYEALAATILAAIPR